MEKVEINKQIVLMRKIVRHTKILVLRKLIKHIKLYKNKLKRCPERTLEKWKRKTERLSEEISVIKKISIDEVSRSALANVDSWEEVLKKKNLSSNEKVVAMLCAHKNIVDCIAKFRETHPDWEAWMIPILKLWERRKALKNRESSQNINDSETLSVDENQSDGDNEVKKFKHKEKTKQLPNKSINKKEAIDRFPEMTEVQNIEKNKTIEKSVGTVEVKQFNELDEKDAKNQIIEKSVGTIEVKQLNLDELHEKDTISETYASKETDYNDTNDMKQDAASRDPFFAGSDKTFLDSSSEMLPHEDNDYKQEDFMEQAKVRSQFVGKLSSRNRHVQHGMSVRGSETQMRSAGYFKKGKWRPLHTKAAYIPRENDWRQHKLRKEEHMQNAGVKQVITSKATVPESASNASLHPSWEAKRQLKAKCVLPFQGKKITFD